MNTHYIYQYKDGNKLLYVGRGTDKNGSFTRARNLRGHKSALQWIREKGKKLQTSIIATDLNLYSAQKLETVLIRELKPPLNIKFHKDSACQDPSFSLEEGRIKRRTEKSVLWEIKCTERSLKKTNRNSPEFLNLNERYRSLLLYLVDKCYEDINENPTLDWERIEDHYHRWYFEEDLSDSFAITLHEYKSAVESLCEESILYWWIKSRAEYKNLSRYGISMPEKFKKINKPLVDKEIKALLLKKKATS